MTMLVRSASEAEHRAVERRHADAAELGGLNTVREDAEDVDPALDHEQRVDLDDRRRLLTLLLLCGGRGVDGGPRSNHRLSCYRDSGDIEDGGHVLGAPAIDESRRDVDGAELPARVGNAERAVEVRERGPVRVAHRRRLLEREGDGAVGGREGREAHGGHRDVGWPRAEEQEQRRARDPR